jgi:hypothetical protein
LKLENCEDCGYEFHPTKFKIISIPRSTVKALIKKLEGIRKHHNPNDTTLMDGLFFQIEILKHLLSTAEKNSNG